MVEVITEETIRFYIQQAIGTEKFKFSIQNTSQKEEGYVGELFFLKIEFKPQVNGKDVLYLILKTNKNVPGQGKSVHLLQDLSKREVFFYSKVVKAYQELQSTEQLRVPFDIVPKCYKTFSEDGRHVIILENLKTDGYVLHPRSQPLNIPHIEMGLRTYAKLHAFSFSLEDQNKDHFQKISRVCTPLRETLVSFKALFDIKQPLLGEYLQEAGRPDLSIAYEKFVHEKSIHDRLTHLSDTISTKQAIIHIDCHNANMLFKYKDDDRTVPEHLVLIDFQGACLHSPVIDLSFLLFANLSPVDLPNIKHYVEYYYTQLCTIMKELGSDPGILFPRNIFEDHIKTYLHYGLLLTLPFLEILYISNIDNNDAPSTMEEESTRFFEGFKSVKTKSRQEYLQRLAAMVDCLLNDSYR